MAKDTVFSQKNSLNLKGNLTELTRPLVMGILNLTDDSFYSQSRVEVDETLIKRAGKMLEDGADILDLGAYSTRPGAADIPEKEEKEKIEEAVKIILNSYPHAVISVDTFRAKVAEAGIMSGAAMINDVSGGEMDRRMFETIAETQVPYVLMHMRGTPATMKNLNHYDNLFEDILKYFISKTEKLKSLGVKDVIIDPGIGFAKNISQNYEILRNLSYFKKLNLPVLAGLSRKSFIYRKTGGEPGDALAGTISANTIALMNGANILRVHDVKEAVETITIYKEAYP